MKKYLLMFAGCLMMCGLTMGLASCSSDDDDDNNKSITISGSWMGFPSDYSCFIGITLNEDGTGCYYTEMDDDGEPIIVEFTYVYTEADNKLVVTTAKGTSTWYLTIKSEAEAMLEADGVIYNLMNMNYEGGDDEEEEEGESPFDEVVEPDPEQPIVGKWMGYSDDKEPYFIILRADHTCRVTIFDEYFQIDIDIKAQWKQGEGEGNYVISYEGMEIPVTLNDDDTITYGGITLSRYTGDDEEDEEE